MESTSLFSMETVSAAMTNAPKSIPVLGGIVKLATDIRETTERVDVNKQQCQRLSERIDTLIGFVAERDFSTSFTDSMHVALKRFEIFLRECLEFISTFLETTWFKRIINNKDHEKKFLDLNRELTQYSNDLNFGMALNNIQRVNASAQNESISSISRGSPIKNTFNASANSVQTGEDFGRSPINTNSISSDTYPSIFISGLWQYRYQQYNQWFGPFQHHIDFDLTRGTLQGYGEDNVGEYVLDGSFSAVAKQIKLILQYRPGTGNPNLNLGHQDILHLTWNSTRNAFEGVAYSQVLGYATPTALIIMSRT